MAGKSPAQRFHANLLNICDLAAETIDWVQSQGIKTRLSSTIIGFAKGMMGGWDAEETISSFIEKSASYWDQILHKDKVFLVENAGVLFKELPAEYVTSFRELFEAKNAEGENAVPDETLESFWEILQAMVRISIRHIHNSRGPEAVEEEVAGVKTVRTRYTLEYFPSISVKQSLEKWGMSAL